MVSIQKSLLLDNWVEVWDTEWVNWVTVSNDGREDGGRRNGQGTREHLLLKYHHVFIGQQVQSVLFKLHGLVVCLGVCFFCCLLLRTVRFGWLICLFLGRPLFCLAGWIHGLARFQCGSFITLLFSPVYLPFLLFTKFLFISRVIAFICFWAWGYGMDSNEADDSGVLLKKKGRLVNAHRQGYFFPSLKRHLLSLPSPTIMQAQFPASLGSFRPYLFSATAFLSCIISPLNESIAMVTTDHIKSSSPRGSETSQIRSTSTRMSTGSNQDLPFSFFRLGLMYLFFFA